MSGDLSNFPIEYPKGSGIRIGVVSNEKKGDASSVSFRVNISAKITGKSRSQKQRSTLQAAKKYAEEQHFKIRSQGRAAFSMSDEQRIDAVRALEVLRGTDLTLEEVARYARPRLRPDNGQCSVQDVADRIIAVKGRMNLRPRTLSDFRNRLSRFCKTFGDANIMELQHTEVIEWIQSLGLSHRSKHNYLMTVNGFFKWAQEENFIVDNPMAKIPKRKLQEIIGRQDDKQPEIYTPREARLLLEAAIGEELFPLLIIGFFCGLRTNELQSLQWENIKFDEKDPFVTVPALIAKSRSLRNVDLNESALKWLSLCERGQGLVFKKRTTAWTRHDQRIHEKAGVSKKNNGLRHSFGSYHYAMFGDEIKTATQMGHNPSDHSLFSNYRALVTKAAAEEFWSITVPAKNEKLVQFA